MKAVFFFMLALVSTFNRINMAIAQQPQGYRVGIDDMLEINVLAPEKINAVVTVAPDGSISFPYVGNCVVKGLTLDNVREEVRDKLADGYMKYPVVAVSLKESRSKKFFVYGEVIKPGTYVLDDGTTILKAISECGGFTRFGSASRVKILRQKNSGPGYEVIKINIDQVMSGNSQYDIALFPGDIIVVSEGLF